MTFRVFKPHFFALGFSFFFSCASKKAFIVPPPPVAFDKEVSEFSQKSVLNIPIEVPLPDIERKINEQLGTLLFEDNSLENNGGDNLILIVKKRSPIQIESKGGNLFNIKVPVNIYAKAGWKVEKFGISVSKYEDTQFDLDMSFLSRISLDKKWKISTSTSPNGYKWISEPKVKIGFFEIPITKIVEKIMDDELPNVTQAVDAEIGKIDLKSKVDMAWKALQEPFLAQEENQAWLKIKPLEMAMTPIGTKGKNVRFSFGITSLAQTLVGNKPAIDPPSQLPDLQVVNKLDERFEVGLLAEVPFASMKKLAMAQVGDKWYSFKEEKYKIKIQNMEFWGNQQDLIIAAELIGSINGKLFFKGKPYFDEASASIKMKDLDYDLETKNKLLKTANWLAHGKFLSMIEPYFAIPVGEQLNEGKKMIQENLAGNKFNKSLNLNGKLNELTPSEIKVTPKGIQALILAKGKLEILVAGF